MSIYGFTNQHTWISIKLFKHLGIQMTVQHFDVSLPLNRLLLGSRFLLQPITLHSGNPYTLQIVLNVIFTNLLHADSVPKLFEIVVNSTFHACVTVKQHNLFVRSCDTFQLRISEIILYTSVWWVVKKILTYEL